MKSFYDYKRGINLGGWLSQYTEYSEQHYSSFINENDICGITGCGLDHVRLRRTKHGFWNYPKALFG